MTTAIADFALKKEALKQKMNFFYGTCVIEGVEEYKLEFEENDYQKILNIV